MYPSSPFCFLPCLVQVFRHDYDETKFNVPWAMHQHGFKARYVFFGSLDDGFEWAFFHPNGVKVDVFFIYDEGPRGFCTHSYIEPTAKYPKGKCEYRYRPYAPQPIFFNNGPCCGVHTPWSSRSPAFLPCLPRSHQSHRSQHIAPRTGHWATHCSHRGRVRCNLSCGQTSTCARRCHTSRMATASTGGRRSSSATSRSVRPLVPHSVFSTRAVCRCPLDVRPSFVAECALTLTRALPCRALLTLWTLLHRAWRMATTSTAADFDALP